jgi:hypothetical protein
MSSSHLHPSSIIHHPLRSVPSKTEANNRPFTPNLFNSGTSPFPIPVSHKACSEEQEQDHHQTLISFLKSSVLKKLYYLAKISNLAQ